MQINVHHYVHFVAPDMSEFSERLDKLQKSVDALGVDAAGLEKMRTDLKGSTDDLERTVKGAPDTTT